MYFQLGFPGRVTFEDNAEGLARAAQLIKKYNGVTPVFRTIYNFTGLPSSKNAVVDKIFFDFDIDDGQELEDVRKLHEELEKEYLDHRLYFSGRGFHLFLKTNPVYAQATPKIGNAIRGAFNYFKDLAGIAPDPHTKDIMRIARLPNTINIKTDLYCIPLKSKEIYQEKKEIEILAKTPRHIDIKTGNNILDLTEYINNNSYEIEYLSEDGLENIGSEFSDDVPLCVLYALKDGDCGYNQRFSIITALRDLTYSKEDVRDILKKYLTEKKYRHCVFEERQLDYLFERQDLVFPLCETLKDYDMCVSGCSGHKIYL